MRSGLAICAKRSFKARPRSTTAGPVVKDSVIRARPSEGPCLSVAGAISPSASAVDASRLEVPRDKTALKLCKSGSKLTQPSQNILFCYFLETFWAPREKAKRGKSSAPLFNSNYEFLAETRLLSR